MIFPTVDCCCSDLDKNRRGSVPPVCGVQPLLKIVQIIMMMYRECYWRLETFTLLNSSSGSQRQLVSVGGPAPTLTIISDTSPVRMVTLRPNVTLEKAPKFYYSGEGFEVNFVPQIILFLFGLQGLTEKNNIF